MGAWGYGLLQNDTAQDGLADLIDTIEQDVAALADRRPDEGTAARLGAAVGLLLQLSSWYSFDPENDAAATIVRAVERQAPKLAALPRPARKLLRDVAGGKGRELAGRRARISKAVRDALFVTPSGDFPMERVFGKREPSLFAHPKAARYVQEVANRCVDIVDEDFADEEVAGDLSREALGMGAFGTLLVIEPCRVPLTKIERWRKAYRRAAAGVVAEGDPDEFDVEYAKCVERAFQLMVRKFSKR